MGGDGERVAGRVPGRLGRGGELVARPRADGRGMRRAAGHRLKLRHRRERRVPHRRAAVGTARGRRRYGRDAHGHRVSDERRKGGRPRRWREPPSRARRCKHLLPVRERDGRDKRTDRGRRRGGRGRRCVQTLCVCPEPRWGRRKAVPDRRHRPAHPHDLQWRERDPDRRRNIFVVPHRTSCSGRGRESIRRRLPHHLPAEWGTVFAPHQRLFHEQCLDRFRRRIHLPRRGGIRRRLYACDWWRHDTFQRRSSHRPDSESLAYRRHGLRNRPAQRHHGLRQAVRGSVRHRGPLCAPSVRRPHDHVRRPARPGHHPEHDRRGQARPQGLHARLLASLSVPHLRECSQPLLLHRGPHDDPAHGRHGRHGRARGLSLRVWRHHGRHPRLERFLRYAHRQALPRREGRRLSHRHGRRHDGAETDKGRQLLLVGRRARVQLRDRV